MSVEITGYIILSVEPSEAFVPSRTIDYIISLDEGHSRPVWQWVKSPHSGKKSAWVPESPNTILADGLLMLISDGLRDVTLRAEIDAMRKSSSALVDLNAMKLKQQFRQSIRAQLAGYVVNIAAWPNSSLLNLKTELANLGVAHQWLINS